MAASDILSDGDWKVQLRICTFALHIWLAGQLWYQELWGILQKQQISNSAAYLAINIINVFDSVADCLPATL